MKTGTVYIFRTTPSGPEPVSGKMYAVPIFGR